MISPSTVHQCCLLQRHLNGTKTIKHNHTVDINEVKADMQYLSSSLHAAEAHARYIEL